MLKKVRYIIVLASLSTCLCFMSNTYSRYVAEASSNIEFLFAKWQILVNTTDITTGVASSIDFVPVIEENANVAENLIAPASKGYFDFLIDPTNVDLSFAYTLNLVIDNAEIPDLKITEYSIVPTNYVEGDPLDKVLIADNVITNSVLFDKETENYKHSPFTIRVYFQWYEGVDELMDNQADTVLGNLAAVEEKKFSISATLAFEQII